ncbi:MAG: DUF2959 domain-containing protein [Desulfobulbaceae bacterium]|nr:DUF2959 domain-containing protein [Desulfobulbaceae bacterium]
MSLPPTVKHKAIPFLAALLCLVLLASCQSAYYSTMEKLGIPKREIMVDRVEAARDSQQQAKKEFASALEEFQAVINSAATPLDEKYKKINKVYEGCADKAEEVRTRIGKIEDVSEALFDEWQAELQLYTSPALKRSSEQKLKNTRNRYHRLIDAMKRAEAKIHPVLDVFRDQVLFLKHNLNAQAIASLQTELNNIETDVARLIREMEASINEADAFLATLNQQ